MGADADALETKPVYLLWFVFTCLETPGECNPGVIPCHYVLLLKARSLFFCHSVETYPGKEGRGARAEKQRHKR